MGIQNGEEMAICLAADFLTKTRNLPTSFMTASLKKAGKTKNFAATAPTQSANYAPFFLAWSPSNGRCID